MTGRRETRNEVHPDEVSEVAESATEVRWFGIVLLIGHLALIVVGAISLWRIAGGWWLGAVVAALFVLGYFALWRYLLAPGSRTRLGYRERLTVSVVLGPAVVVVASLAELWVPALVATCVMILGDALNSRR
ncbi:hypothetical protein H5392_00210 [Tessaracoccus sp. MC1865]|uniref:hypothetical protein n=1 Tax=Tessaracoccus sp. MC1865 TaxID=2760310 RepID=UPI0015FFD3FE|nr:hypothetical protein [Tessaracoccus sp. MC1865]MBB1482282.1 hypothetical protein [Tessaracoccus sp. MC1865]QTO38247.1 hypothetical protein J7D54_03865 [Tessaracoccus sp. MC1865]